MPKVVIVITDGESNEPFETLTQAKRIKDRGINIVSVGIGNLREQELIDMASSINDVYKVDDFDKVLLILSSISLTACQQSAAITEEKQIKSEVVLNGYRYFRYSLEDKPENFTIEIEDVKGETEFFYSFEDETPKSSEDYITNLAQSEFDMNFIEKRSIRNEKATSRVVEKKKYIQITKPLGVNAEFLFMGIKGKSEQNEFQVYIYKKVISTGPADITNMLFLTIAIESSVLLIAIIMLVIVCAKYKQKTGGQNKYEMSDK